MDNIKAIAKEKNIALEVWKPRRRAWRASVWGNRQETGCYSGVRGGGMRTSKRQEDPGVDTRIGAAASAASWEKFFPSRTRRKAERPELRGKP